MSLANTKNNSKLSNSKLLNKFLNISIGTSNNLTNTSNSSGTSSTTHSSSSSSTPSPTNLNEHNHLNEQTSNNTPQSRLNLIRASVANSTASVVSSIQNFISSSNLNNNHNTSISSSSSSSQNNMPLTHSEEANFNTRSSLNSLASHAAGAFDSNSSDFARNATHITNLIKVEKKQFDKVNKLAEKILKYCRSDKMNLINSPPYIIDILPDVCHVFNTIYFVYEDKLHILNNIEYFCIILKNTLEKFQETIDLFKEAGKKMYEENGKERQKLVKQTLTFSHMLAEIKSIFPKDLYEGQNFRIAKKDAEEFWKNNFDDRIVVSWIEFEMKLNQVHKITDRTELLALRETIQLTKTKYVSIFEFDIFTRLFQPWNNLLNNWKFLVTEHPGYMAFSTYDEVHKRLQNYIDKSGSYLFRLSCTKLGQWAIGYVTSDHKILQTIPQSLIQALIDGKHQLYVYPDGRDIKIDISSAIAVTSASRIQISKEQQEMYVDLGTTFQLCKICNENNKDRKIEPCGHLICSNCLESWQELQATPTCPFCRCEIKTFEPIIISPFEAAKKKNDPKPQTQKFSSDPNPNMNLIDEATGSDYIAPNSENQKDKSNFLKPPNTNTEASSEDEYILPTPSNGKNLSNSDFNKMSINSKNDMDSRHNLDLILSKNQNRSSISSMHNPPLLPPPPPPPTMQNSAISLPPPPTPPTLQSSISQTSNSGPVLPPPPPVPPNSIRSSLNSAGQSPSGHSGANFFAPSNQTIVSTQQSNSSKNTFIFKIENEKLFDQLTSEFGNDKTKAMCALILANNDLKIARNILSYAKND